MTPIEAAARAILKEAGLINNPSIQIDLSDRPAISLMYARRYARAVLVAIRVPSEAMVQAGEGETTPSGCWSMMVEAALAEGPDA